MKYVECEHCRCPHLDKDWFSVHRHQRHLCAGCGRLFRDTERSIGNPVCNLQERLKYPRARPQRALRGLELRQADYAGGVRIWGSNPAIVWTGDYPQTHGIHVHAFSELGSAPIIDDTFSSLTIDGVTLHPEMVRVLMAQSALSQLTNRIVSLSCPRCGKALFSCAEDAFTPKAEHACTSCKRVFPTLGRVRYVVSNPLFAVLERLESWAPRARQRHRFDLVPEVPTRLSPPLLRASSQMD
jgi:hypothetical protein